MQRFRSLAEGKVAEKGMTDGMGFGFRPIQKVNNRIFIPKKNFPGKLDLKIVGQRTVPPGNHLPIESGQVPARSSLFPCA